MKNMKKFVAAFAAAAMVMSMGVSAFADVLVPFEAVTEQNNEMYNESTKKLVININDETQAQLTMMAYLVPADTELTDDAENNYGIPPYAGQTIIALDQNAGANGFTEVPIDETKLENNSIVVKIGGSAGEVATYLISLAEEIVTYEVVYELYNGTVTNPDAPNAESFDANTTIKTFIDGLTDLSKDGYNFLGWSTSANKEDIIDTTTIDEDALMASLDTDSDMKVTLYAIFELIEQETIQILIADVNGDDAVNVDDMNEMIIYIKHNLTHPDYLIGTPISGSTKLLGDVNADNAVNVDDMNEYIIFIKHNLSHPDYDFSATVSVQK